jgi:hypothetical protein
MRDQARPPARSSPQLKADDALASGQAPLRSERATPAGARRRAWGLSRQARRRNLRLMLMLLGPVPMSRQA